MVRKKVVIVGSGFGGLNAAKALKSADMDIVVIDKTNHHLFQPLLYQVATCALGPRDIAAPIREVLKRHENTQVIFDEVAEVHPDAKSLSLVSGKKVSYDYLVLATGARHSYFGHDEWSGVAPGLKTLDDALRIRENILLAFERAESCDSPEEAAKYLTFVIVGGGPTGVELSGAIAEIAHRTMKKNFRHINPDNTKIYLVEAGAELLKMYPPFLSETAQRDLEKMGVQIYKNSRVTHIDEDGVELDGQRIDSKTVFWAAGNQAPKLLESLGVPLDHQRRVLVEEDLSVSGYPDLFVIGDSAHVKEKNGNPVPAIAPPAMQMGHYVAKLIREETPKEKRKPFKYFDKGSMATIGRSKAVVMVGKWMFYGFFAWLLWCFIHLAYLVGFRNRFVVLTQWYFSFITESRSARVILNDLK